MAEPENASANGGDIATIVIMCPKCGMEKCS